MFSLDGRTAVVVGSASAMKNAISAALEAAGASVTELPAVGDACADIDTTILAIAGLPAFNILVNLVGFDDGVAFGHVSEQELDAVIENVVEGSFLLSQAAVAKIRSATPSVPRADIIHVVSPLARVGAVDRSLCCMAMHALRGLTMASAAELGPMGIRVNMVEVSVDEAREHALPNVATNADVAASIVYLSSPAAAAMTGSSLLLDAGWTAR